MKMLVKMLVGLVLLSGAWAGYMPAAGEEMIEHDGKFYIVSGATLVRVNLKTLEVEARMDLSDIGKDADADEQEKQRRQEWLARFDGNGDGEISGDELDENRWLRRMDRNDDGKITTDEVPVANRPAPGSRGDAKLLVKGDTLYMLRGGMLFAFDLKTLELKSSVRISEEETPRNQFPGGVRGGGRGGRGGRGGQAGQTGNAPPPPPPVEAF